MDENLDPPLRVELERSDSGVNGSIDQQNSRKDSW